MFLAPLGKSDHNCVLLNPSVPMQHPVGYRNTTYRRLTDIIVERIINGKKLLSLQPVVRTRGYYKRVGLTKQQKISFQGLAMYGHEVLTSLQMRAKFLGHILLYVS